jgi:CRISPR-associated protein Cas1
MFKTNGERERDTEPLEEEFSSTEQEVETTVTQPDKQTWARFDFTKRNRRPPRDPVNALLSFVYAMLLKDLVATLVGVGLDPYLGFYHQPRYGRPALALDLMEEFRPLVADSVVINLINNGEVRPTDFITRAGACALTPHGRKQVLEGYERRLDTLVTHPHFGYAISYRRIFEVQARLLARHLTGEINFYPAFCTR